MTITIILTIIACTELFYVLSAIYTCCTQKSEIKDLKEQLDKANRENRNVWAQLSVVEKTNAILEIQLELQNKSKQNK